MLVLVYALKRQVHDSKGEKIFVGHYVTKLSKAMNVWNYIPRMTTKTGVNCGLKII